MSKIDVLCVGSAIVDVISAVPESFIVQHRLAKGSMTLISLEQATQIQAAMGTNVEISGGSAANTAIGVASFGGSAAYIGKVSADKHGEVFMNSICSEGVFFDMPSTENTLENTLPTARSLVLVTPDAERTMSTYLGISAFLSPKDIDLELVASSRIVYCEGYLWDTHMAKQAILHVLNAAHNAKRTVSISLSDSRCVDRHRDEWLSLIDDYVDVVFANEAEACSLTSTDDFSTMCKRFQSIASIVVITRGENGSVVLSGNETMEIPAVAVADVVDLTGAGDMYASGFLWGLSHNAPLGRCAEFASLAASEIISHIGARPVTPLSQYSIPLSQ